MKVSVLSDSTKNVIPTLVTVCRMCLLILYSSYRFDASRHNMTGQAGWGRG